MVEILSQDLLGRHVTRRAEREPGGGEVPVLRNASSQAEVGEHGAAVVVDEDVVRLEVAVDDAGVVGVLEPVANLSQVAPCGRAIEGAPVEDVSEGALLDEGHGEEDDVAGHDEVVDGEDVGVVEAREGPGLELEALEEALILFQVGEEGLEGDLAAEGLLGRAVHDGHSAGAEALVDVVVADSRAGEVLAGACVLHSEQKDRRRPLDLTSPSGGTRARLRALPSSTGCVAPSPNRRSLPRSKLMRSWRCCNPAC